MSTLMPAEDLKPYPLFDPGSPNRQRPSSGRPDPYRRWRETRQAEPRPSSADPYVRAAAAALDISRPSSPTGSPYSTGWTAPPGVCHLRLSVSRLVPLIILPGTGGAELCPCV